jgi:hypothetical protein
MEKILRIKSSAHPQMELVLSPDWNYLTIRRSNDHDDYFQFASVLVGDLISSLQEVQRSLEKKPVVNALEDVNLGLLKEKAKKKSSR